MCILLGKCKAKLFFWVVVHGVVQQSSSFRMPTNITLEGL